MTIGLPGKESRDSQGRYYLRGSPPGVRTALHDRGGVDPHLVLRRDHLPAEAFKAKGQRPQADDVTYGGAMVKKGSQAGSNSLRRERRQ